MEALEEEWLKRFKTAKGRRGGQAGFVEWIIHERRPHYLMPHRLDLALHHGADIAWPIPQRQLDFDAWLAEVAPAHQLHPKSLRLASADASFRRYLRIDSATGSRIIMDAPPDKEDSQPFVQVASLMAQAGVKAPEVLTWDRLRGFMLLTDLGPKTMMQSMHRDGAPPLNLYQHAIDLLVQWQLASRAGVLPNYDRALLLREMELFPQWYITAHRQMPLDATQRKTLDDAFSLIASNNLAWPSVYVHCDFMPRNIMVDNGKLGLLDFQDALYGPITYDIASLMRDAFLSWEEDFCLDVTVRYWEKARKSGLPVGNDFGEFYRGVEWMGLQRHLRIAGIFARLTLRDGKPHYLADAPRFIGYMRTTCARYRELKPLLRLIEQIEGIEVPSGFAFGRI
jgi:aminoglycoside/choline kinase family phosphotransferase